MINNTKTLTEFVIKNIEKKVDIAVDMTCGNGFDTKMIKEELKPQKIYAFDIQDEAIENTKKLLKEQQNIEIIKDSHSNIDKYIAENIDFAIYNLGYRPKGDKLITTIGEVVIESLEKLLEKLSLGGIVIITCYPGHKAGQIESDMVVDFLNKIDQKKYNIIKFDFINQKNQPPFVISIEKSKSDQ